MVNYLTSKKYTRLDLELAMSLAGVPEDKQQMVMATLAPDIPSGYIRHKEACEKYGLSDALLSMWIRREKVQSIRWSGRQAVFVLEADVKRAVEAMPAKS